MKMNCFGKSYWVTFKYKDNQTTCSIYNDTIQGSPTLVSTGVAFRSPEDTHVKEIGRKVSFTKALGNLTMKKEVRQILWEQYLNRKLEREEKDFISNVESMMILYDKEHNTNHQPQVVQWLRNYLQQ